MADLAGNSMRSSRPFPHPLPIGMFHLDGDDGAGRGGGEGDGDGAGDGGAGDAGGQGGNGGERTFTQADVDRILQERLARAKSTPPADYEDLKAAAAELAQIKEANATELEKAQTAAETAASERDAAVAEAKEIRIRSAILAEAAKPERKIVDPDLVVTLLGPDVEFDDQGTPTNIAKAMDTLLEARPYLVASGGSRGNADQGARGGGANQLSDADLKSMTPEQIVKAHEQGRLASVLSPTR